MSGEESMPVPIEWALPVPQVQTGNLIVRGIADIDDIAKLKSVEPEAKDLFLKALDAGKRKEFSEAVKHATLAHERGHPRAGALLRHIRTHRLALADYFSKAAERHPEKATRFRSFAAAFRWGANRQISELADRGDAPAQYMLGKIFHEGQGWPQSDTRAVDWWQKAADQGVNEAQYQLGRAYSKGRGVPKDLVKAHMWFTLSRSWSSKIDFSKSAYFLPESFNPTAELQCLQLVTLMTREQVAEARDLAAKWIETRAA